MVEQDRQLDRQRLQERRDQTAELAATALQRTLAELEERLATVGSGSPLSRSAIPEGVALVILGPRGVVERAGTLLPYDLETGTERQIVKNPLLSLGISLSPDGTYVAAKTLDNPNKTQTLQVIPIAGGAPRELLRLQEPDRLDRGPIAWTPDGKNVIVVRTVSSRLGVWLVPIDGSTPRKLDLDYSSWIEGAQGPLDEGFSLSPDGRQIVFAMGKNSSEVWALENILPARPRPTAR